MFVYKNFASSTLVDGLAMAGTTMRVRTEDVHLFPTLGVGEEFAIILWDGAREPEVCYVTANAAGTFTITRGEEDTTARDWLAGTQVRHALTSGTLFSLIQQSTFLDIVATPEQAALGSSNTVLMTPAGTTDFWEARTTELSREFMTSETREEARRVLGWATATFDGTGLQDTFAIGDAAYDSPYTRVYVDETFVPSDEYVITGGTIVFDVPPPAGTKNVVVVLGTDFAFSVSLPGAGSVDTSTLQDEAVTKPKIKPGEIYGNLIPNGGITSVHYGAGSIPTAAYGAGSVDSVALAAGAAETSKIPDQAVTRPKLAAAERFPYGAVIDFAGTVAPSGWLLCFGQAVSRTTYANLFAAIGTTWGAGNGTTTFNVPDLRGRATFGADAMGGSAANRLTSQPFGVGGAVGAVGGEERHLMTWDEMPAHRHTVYRPRGDAWFSDGSGNTWWGSAAIVPTLTDYAGLDVPHNNMPPAAVTSKIIFTGVV